MEQGLKEFASGVEQLVDRLVSTPILHEGRSSHAGLSADQRQSIVHTKYLPHQLTLYRSVSSLFCHSC